MKHQPSELPKFLRLPLTLIDAAADSLIWQPVKVTELWKLSGHSQEAPVRAVSLRLAEE